MYIDISTQELKELVYKLFDSFTKIGDIYKYYGVSDSSRNIRYVRKIAEQIGFDLGIYKERKQRFCLRCGKVLTNKQHKFCSSSCAATYNNLQRGNRSEDTKNKIKQSLHAFYGTKSQTDKGVSDYTTRHIKKCIVCGNPIVGSGRITCSTKCYEIHLNESRNILYCKLRDSFE